MSDFGPSIAAEVVAACQQGAAAAGEALSLVCERQLQLVAGGEPGTLDLGALPSYLQGPGLVLMLKLDAERAAMILLPPAPGILPDWMTQPDTAGKEKLESLAQQLGAALLPAEFAPTSYATAWLDDLSEALLRGQLSSDAAILSLTLSADDSDAILSLVWPVPSADAILQETAPAAESPASAASESQPPLAVDDLELDIPDPMPHAPALVMKPRDFEEALEDLPSYTRSLLKIEVPIIVTLANAKQSLMRILTLVPGTLLQFDKSCEEPLTLEIGTEQVAIGEAVKIGDKFGFRVTAITMPREKLLPIEGRRKAELAHQEG